MVLVAASTTDASFAVDEAGAVWVWVSATRRAADDPRPVRVALPDGVRATGIAAGPYAVVVLDDEGGAWSSEGGGYAEPGAGASAAPWVSVRAAVEADGR